MPAAIAIPLIMGAVSAGTAVAGAKMASNASKNAAKTQSAAADRAMGVQSQQYQQARQDFDPYRQQGVNAINSLGQMAGRQPINFDPSQSMGIPGVPQGQQGHPQYPPMPQQGFQQMQRPPMGPQMGQLGMPSQGPPQGQQGPPPQSMQQAGQQEQTVMLRAPNGQTQAVPAHLAPQLIARGAVRVG